MIIVVTGVTRGLGRALADRFVEAGHQVVGCGRSQDHIDQLRSEFGEPHRFESVDVTVEKQVVRFAAVVTQDLGIPDIVVNNAGLINRTAPLWEVGAEEFSRVVDTNLKGVASVLRAFAPSMVERQRGVFVNMSSTWGRSVAGGEAPYCATKWAIEGLSQAMAQELPAGMASVALNPGIIDTDMLRVCFGGGASAFPSPEDWSRKAAPLILGLASSDNGRSLSV